MHLRQSARLIIISSLVILTSANYHCTSWCFKPGSLKNCSQEIHCKVQKGYNDKPTYKKTAPRPRNFHLSYKCTENPGEIGLLIEWDVKGSYLRKINRDWKIIIEEQDGHSELKTIKIGTFASKKLPKEYMVHFRYFYVGTKKFPMYIWDDVTYVVTLESIPIYSLYHKPQEVESKVYIPKDCCKHTSNQTLATELLENKKDQTLATEQLENKKETRIHLYSEVLIAIISFIGINVLVLSVVFSILKLYRRGARVNKDQQKTTDEKIMMIANTQNKEDTDFGHIFACKLRKDFELNVTTDWEARSKAIPSRREWHLDMMYSSSIIVIINPPRENDSEEVRPMKDQEFFGTLRMAKESAMSDEKIKLIYLSTGKNNAFLKNSEKRLITLWTTMTKLSQVLNIFGKRNSVKYEDKTIAEYVNVNMCTPC